jgi:hypothetical protein
MAPESHRRRMGEIGHSESLGRLEISPTSRLSFVAAVFVTVAQGEGHVAFQPAPQSVAAGPHQDQALEFVRFCYRRRRVGWPALYDEMCAVASRGAYHGLGFADLAERGITFCLSDMPRWTALLQQVMAEDRSSTEATLTAVPMTLSPLPAGS